MTRHQQYLADRWDRNGVLAPRWVNIPEGKKAPKGATTRTIGGPTPATHTWADAYTPVDALDAAAAITSEAVQHHDYRRRARRWSHGKRDCFARFVSGITFGLVQLPREVRHD